MNSDAHALQEVSMGVPLWWGAALCFFFMKSGDCVEGRGGQASLPYVLSALIITPSFPVYKAYTYIKIQTLSSLTNNLTIKFLFL